MRVAALLFHNPPDNLNPIADALLRFSPQLCLKRTGTIFIEVGKCRQLYREETFLARVKILLKKFDLQASVAIGDHLLEALILARYGTTDASRLSTVSFREYFDPFLSDPSSFKLIDRMVESLEHLGIVTNAGYLSIPAVQLSSRFGAMGQLIRLRMLGEAELGWPLWMPEETVEDHVELFDGDRCSDLEPLLFYFRPMLERTFARLWGRGLRASAIRVRLTLEKYSTVKEPIREWRMEFLLPQATARGTLPILRERLERDLSRKPLESSVTAIDLEILQTSKDYHGQRHFFQNKEDIQEAFNSAISQLAEGLGKEKVFRAHIHEESVAERSWTRSFSEQKSQPDLSDYIPLRPTRLLKRPEKVQLSKEMIFIRKRGYRVLKWSCVEQIATHWLDSIGVAQKENSHSACEEVVRSYYKIDIEKKPSVGVFKCPQDEYYLHGWFE